MNLVFNFILCFIIYNLVYIYNLIITATTNMFILRLLGKKNSCKFIRYIENNKIYVGEKVYIPVFNYCNIDYELDVFKFRNTNKFTECKTYPCVIFNGKPYLIVRLLYIKILFLIYILYKIIRLVFLSVEHIIPINITPILLLSIFLFQIVFSIIIGFKYKNEILNRESMKKQNFITSSMLFTTLSLFIVSMLMIAKDINIIELYNLCVDFLVDTLYVQ